jgi:predicted phage terminase large subunit-like protein
VGKHKTPTHNSNDLIGYYHRVDPESYDFIEFPALDDENEPLWKERYSTDELLKKKEVVGERVFQSVYQQKPIDATSDFFNMKHLKFGLPENFDEQSVCRAWDIASSDALSNNDFTAGVKIQRYDDYCIISDLVHGRFGGSTKNIIQGTATRDTPNVHVVIETGVAAAGKLLYDEWCNQLKGFIVEQAKVSGGGSKVDRATPLKNAIEDGKVYINIEDDELRQIMIDELSSFPNGEHDDITDAISHGYNYLFVNEETKKKSTAKMGVVFL